MVIFLLQNVEKIFQKNHKGEKCKAKNKGNIFSDTPFIV
jgi:uncharacterized ubiquitin-like protein YukD